jgi:hypothetical protein
MALLIRRGGLETSQMQNNVSPIWQRLPTDIVARTERYIDAGCEQNTTRGDGYLFFRADDIAVPGKNFTRLLELFSTNRLPLCLAVVPAWLTRPRWLALKRAGQKAAFRWCWHQHGWRHINHEINGKKQEFGAGRSRADLEHDIACGRQRLESLLGKSFYPVFTPPWNRCGRDTLASLCEMEYRAVSRSRNSRPEPPVGLQEIPVNVDLHTLKAQTPEAAWERLLSDLDRAVVGGVCGIMIHHRVMTDAAFDFLHMLLRNIAARRRLIPATFRELVDDE